MGLIRLLPRPGGARSAPDPAPEPEVEPELEAELAPEVEPELEAPSEPVAVSEPVPAREDPVAADPVEVAQLRIPFIVDRTEAEAGMRGWLSRRGFFAPSFFAGRLGG